MFIYNRYVSTAVYFFVLWLSARSEDFGPEYGNEWLYFIDDNGTQHVMNFTSAPCDTRNNFFGDAYFYLYTRKNLIDPEQLLVRANDSLVESNYFNKSNGIRVITHGWLSSTKTEWVQDMKKTFLREYDLNIIAVDWSELSKNPFYPWPAYSTRYVGKRIAQLISGLTKSYNIKGAKVHLIGHSLGAQIMGYAGMFSENKIFRITGLDPARPLFEIPEMPTDFVLDRTDAEFVDIIHTCGGTYGYRKSYGHADFYPNSGKPAQPGCSGGRPIADGCSHGRAYEYFEESIEYKAGAGFLAYPCESWEKFKNGECKENAISMGYPAASDSRGNYFLHTRNTSKYANTDE